MFAHFCCYMPSLAVIVDWSRSQAPYGFFTPSRTKWKILPFGKHTLALGRRHQKAEDTARHDILCKYLCKYLHIRQFTTLKLYLHFPRW